jgi:hypothetical protein
MWDAIYRLVERNATWPVLALLFILFLLCFAGFQWRNKVVGDTLESSVCYTPGKASKILHAMGDRGRNIYALTEITLDFVFPFIYGGLFAILLFHVYSRGNARWLLLIPFITVVADLLENFTVAYLAWSFKEGEPSPLAWAATTFTVVKTALFILSLVLILIGAVGSIWSADKPSG